VKKPAEILADELRQRVTRFTVEDGELDDVVDAALSALEAQGLKIVPVEPTEAMLYEADERMRKWIPMPTYRGEYTSVLKDAYAALLNAGEG